MRVVRSKGRRSAGNGSEESGGGESKLRLCRGNLAPSPRPPARPQLPAHCSQTRRFGRDSRSPHHSGSWLKCTCSWRHSGTAWAHTRPRGAWQLGDRASWCGQWALPLGRTTPTSDLCPPNPPCPPSPGVLRVCHLAHMTHRCPDTAATTLPTISRSPVGH